MNDPETALKNAVFEYLLATNNLKSAEVFFRESNLESQYDVSVDVMLHNSSQYGNSCLICKLFNNWYSFAQNQRNITPQPTLVHKDENLQHMQQFLDFYHIHDKNHTHVNGSACNLCTMSPFAATISPHTINYSSSMFSPPPQNMITNNSNFSSPQITTTISPQHTNNIPNSPANDSNMSSPIDIPTTSNNEMNTDKTNDALAKENEFLFSVERKLFGTSNSSTTPTESNISNSDTLLQLLTLDTMPFSNNTPNPANPSQQSFSSPTISSSISPSISSSISPSLPPSLSSSISPVISPSINPSPGHVHTHSHSHPPHSHSHSHSHSNSHSHSHSLSHGHTHMANGEENKDEQNLENPEDANLEMQNKAGRFCCPYPNCNKSFSTSAILKRHIKEHSGDRPYKCTFEGCGKGFARNYDLKVHMRSHTGEKPYRCTFMGCERTFTRSSDLRLHERIHKGEKPFVCDCNGCQKRFVRYADLKKHKRTHEVHEGHHPHVHGAGCGHTAIAHEDHIDYLHDAHLHNHHKDHIDDHKIGLTEANPIVCTHIHPTTSAFLCDPTHTHNDNCGHELVPHYDHYDYLVDGHLHYVHDSHCDDHGWIDVVNWNPSDFSLDPSHSPTPSPSIQLSGKHVDEGTCG